MSLFSDNAYLFDGGTSMGGAPIAGNYAPNQTEMVMARMRAAHDQQTQAYLLENDRRAQFAARATASAVAGKNAGAWYQENGKAASYIAGMAINSRIGASLFGGSVMDQYAGMAAGLGMSGPLRFGPSTTGMPGGYVTGNGAITEAMSRMMMSRMQDDFYSTSGGAKLHKTYGFDRGDIGSIAAYMGARGGYSGMMMGQMHSIGSRQQYDSLMGQARREKNYDLVKELDAYKDSDFKVPVNVMDLGQGASKAINEKISSGAKALAGIKDILGGRPIEELASVAEQLTGVSLAGANGPGAIQARVERVKNFAQTHGMSAQAVLNEQMGIAERLRTEEGLSKEQAAAASEIVQTETQNAVDSQSAKRGRLGSQGFSIRERSRDEISALKQRGLGQIDRESQVVTGALIALQDRKDLSEDDRKKIQDALSGVKNVGGDSPQARFANWKAAQKTLESTVLGVTGENATDLAKNGYLDQNSAREKALMNMNELRSREGNVAGQLLRRSGFDKKYGAGTSSGIQSLFSTLDDETFSVVQKAMQSSDVGAAKGAILSAIGLSDEDKKSLTGILDSRTGDASNFGKAMLGSVAKLANSGIAGSHVSKMDEFKGSAARAQQMLAMQAFGTGTTTDTLGSFVQGLLGGSSITPEAVMEYATATGKSAQVGTVKDGKLEVSSDQAKKLMSQSGDYMTKLFGLAGSDDEKASQLQKALQSQEGFLKFMDYSRDNGDTVRKGKDGNLYFLGKEDFNKTQTELDNTKEATAYSKLMGGTVEDIKGKLSGDKETKDKFAADASAFLGDNADKLLKNVYSANNDFTKNDTWNSLKTIAQDTGMTSKLDDRLSVMQSDVEKKAKTDSRYKVGVDKIKEMRESLSQAGKDSPVDIGTRTVELLSSILQELRNQ